MLDLSVSREAVAAYLTFRYVPAPGTIFNEVQKLEPGRVLRIGSDGATASRALLPLRAEVPNDSKDFAEALEVALVASVKRRFEASDVPVGLFLSGGIDSSLVAALAARHTDVRFTAFTFAFDADPDNEAEAARAIARHLGIPHETITAGSAGIRARIDSLGTRLDEPLADRSCLPFEWLCEIARASVKVVVGGDGGDELFLGYDRYLPALAARAGTAEQTRAQMERYLRERLAVIPLDVMRAEMPDATGMIEHAIDAMAGAAAGARPGRMLADADFSSYMPGAVLAKVDRMSMRHGLEVRTPFLSPEMMALAGAVPAEVMAPEGRGKGPLRKILEKYLPAELRSRPKQGFGIPARIFEAEAEHVFARFRDAALALARAGWLGESPESNKRLFDAASRNINGIWAMVILQQWMAKRGIL